jgi:hypothetical protein
MFGGAAWGSFGTGHVILVVGEQEGGFVVEDPAGSFTLSSGRHYGPGKCGHLAIYPVDMMEAYASSFQGRVMIPLHRDLKVDPTVVSVAGSRASYWIADAKGHRSLPSGPTLVPGTAVFSGLVVPTDTAAPFAGQLPVRRTSVGVISPGAGLTIHASGRYDLLVRTVHVGGKLTLRRLRGVARGGVVFRIPPANDPKPRPPADPLHLVLPASVTLPAHLVVRGQAPGAGHVAALVDTPTVLGGAGSALAVAGPFKLDVQLHLLVPSVDETVEVVVTWTDGTGLVQEKRLLHVTG